MVISRCKSNHFSANILSLPRKFALGQAKTLVFLPRDPNFKTMNVGRNVSVEQYAIGVCNELLWGLTGLVEEG